MNWLYIGGPLALFYTFWFSYLIYQRRYKKPLLLFAIAHFPYLLVNLVAPFRGILDPNYAGYSMGWISLPKGIIVPLVVGSIVVVAFVLCTRALQGRMEKLWPLALVFDLFLLVMIAVPVLIDVVGDIQAFRVELGEYFQVSGWFVALVILLIFPLPTLYASVLSGKMFKDRVLLKSTT